LCIVVVVAVVAIVLCDDNDDDADDDVLVAAAIVASTSATALSAADDAALMVALLVPVDLLCGSAGVVVVVAVVVLAPFAIGRSFDLCSAFDSSLFDDESCVLFASCYTHTHTQKILTPTRSFALQFTYFIEQDLALLKVGVQKRMAQQLARRRPLRDRFQA
jgi:hypothetical protein